MTVFVVVHLSSSMKISFMKCVTLENNNTISKMFQTLTEG